MDEWDVPVEVEKRRRGPAQMPADQVRGRRLSVYLNHAEYVSLEKLAARVNLKAPAYLREAAFSRLPSTIPEVNLEAWALLSRAAANLNQISHRLNLYEGGAGLLPHISELREILGEFRCELIGAKSTLGDDDESED